jgi:hypothetical protein
MSSDYRPILLSLVAATTALILFAGCAGHSARFAAPATSTLEPVAQYVGSEACAACHPREAEGHRGTGHAQTLRFMPSDAATTASPPVGAIPRSDLAIEGRGDGFVVRNPLTRTYLPLTLAFGSGKQGFTYATTLDETTLFEMNYSYFPAGHKWYVTPGHGTAVLDRKSLGMNLSGPISRDCILCHATALPEASLRIEPKFLGVGCESCHGPGSAHIAAASTPGANDLRMASLVGLGGRQINSLCGRCHRTPGESERMPLDQRATQRFFPYGLAISRCFQKSQGRFTCITCHDPHRDLVNDAKFYEARCLSCHTARASDPTAPGGHAAQHVTICKVNPRSGCIGCHMPRRRSFPGTTLPIFMADHWIRINR